MAGSPLRELADRAGIIPEYLDQTGREKRETSDATRVAILAAMGIDASTDAAARAALEAWRAEERAERLAPVRVVAAGSDALGQVEVRGPRGRWRWTLELEGEDGAVRRGEGAHAGGGRVPLPMPARPGPGYHTLRLTMAAARREERFEQSLIVVPPRCVLPREVLGDRRAFGVIANLYSVHSERNWGVGDFTDLAALARWAGSVGADFVGVNPLHALLDRGADVSPYSPVSRLFRNWLYIDVEAVPELRDAPEVADRIAHPELQAELAALRETHHVRYEQAALLKLGVLEALHRVFARREGGARRRAYDEFVRAREPELTRFATWTAIGEWRGAGGEARAGVSPFDWRAWPAELRDAASPAVQRFAEEHAARVDFHRWLQFEADRQLGEAARAAREGGLAIGLYQDLAIGTSPTGSDTWTSPGLFVADASIGAPPDPYAMQGQNWGLPPIDPRGLTRDRYRYYVRLLRSAFRHAGALRMDHVMGLFRLFWIPRGLSGRDGAYVRYPSADLLGILALESVRHGAIVVGEDLGTVPRDVPPALERWGILSSKVLYFERDGKGGFKAGSRYPALALATANTHDMATLAGYWRERDLAIRQEVGLCETEEQLRQEREARAREKLELVRRLELDGALPRDWGRRAGLGAEPPAGAPPGEEIVRRQIAALRGAVHDFLCRTPSVLVGLSLDDLLGEIEPVNVPGVGADRFPSWTRRMRAPIESLASSADVREALRCTGRDAATRESA